MILLGIDPGALRIGYGFVKHERGRLMFLEAGLLAITAHKRPTALVEVEQQLETLLKATMPERAAVETLSFVKNRKTGLHVAETRGVILAVLMRHRLHVEEYSPTEVKSAVCGFGHADKKAVQKMVRVILGEPRLLLPDDASDALAVAICASRRRHGRG